MEKLDQSLNKLCEIKLFRRIKESAKLHLKQGGFCAGLTVNYGGTVIYGGLQICYGGILLVYGRLQIV